MSNVTDHTGLFRARWSLVLLLSLFLFQASRAQLAITYCSPENVSGDNQPEYAEFQSTGLCGDRCQGSFAFAVLQGHTCWCSNYAPANQQDTLSCNEPCPGIDSEWCGSESAGLYGYFQLPGGRPLGTSGTGASQASSTSFSSVSTIRMSSSISPSPVSSTSISRTSSRPSSSPLVTVVPSQSSVQLESSTSSSSSVYTTPSSTESTSTSPFSTPPFSPSPTSTPTELYTSVTTVTGQIRTVVVTPSGDALLGKSSPGGGSGVDAGKIAGVVVGVVVGLGLIIGGAIWYFRRRRQTRETSPEGSFTAERLGDSSNTSNSVPSRQVSQLSSAALLGKAPRIQTNFYPSDNDPRSAGTTSSNNLDRRSLGTDQRLNPWAIYSQDDRLSSVSLQDNQDYSRQLRIANPD